MKGLSEVSCFFCKFVYRYVMHGWEFVHVRGNYRIYRAAQFI